jgi:polysaccharide export outer membrane protein
LQQLQERFMGKANVLTFINEMRRSFLPLLMALALSACASSPEIQPLTSKMPEAPAAEELPPYRVQIGDVLDVKFKLNPELDETLTVRPDGMISTSLFEDIKVYDLSIKQVNQKLRNLYSQELKNPKISTIVRSFAPTRVYVAGEVRSPGEFIVVGPTLTLTQAIARAGGTLNSADEDGILILRRGSGNEGKMYSADYHAATQGGDPSKDPRLAPFDVVFVPKSGAALTYRVYQQYLQQFINPSVGATYQINSD